MTQENKSTKKLTQEQKEKLEKIIENGKWNYVLGYGSLYGLGMFIFMWFFETFIFKGEFYVGLNLILWGIAGLIAGFWGWYSINKKLIDKDSNPSK